MIRNGWSRNRDASWRIRISLALIGLVAIILVYAIFYQWAVAAFTGTDISFAHSIHVVIEALTTAGFGGDSDLWRQSDALLIYVVMMNLTGVLLVFLAFPLFVFPLFREAIQTGPPRSSSLTDHVIICGFSPQDEVLTAELAAADIPYLFISTEEAVVTDLTERGIEAMIGDPDDIDVLQAANLEAARAIVADMGDQLNPAIVLTAKQLQPDIRAVSIVRDPTAEPFHRLAQADEIILGPKLIGIGLGHRAGGTFAEKLREAIAISADISITELRVEQNSRMVGQTIREAEWIAAQNITVIGMWSGGKFIVSPHPDTRIDANTILLVAGTYDIPSDVKAVEIPQHADDEPHVAVCGYGTVGQATAETLRSANHQVTVIDLDEKPGVDVVGDIADPETYEPIELDTLRAVVFSIDEDVKTIYATLILNHLAPDLEIIVRADDARTVQDLYNAGADFVLSLPEVTGEIVASILIDDEEFVTPDVDFVFTREAGGELAGKPLAETDLRRKTGCSVVAVERDGALLTDVKGDFVPESDDVLIVAGTSESHERYDRWCDQQQANR